MLEGIPAPLGFDELARRAGLSRRELFLRVLAWRSGGRAGYAVHVESWEPEPSDMEPGRVALGPGARVSANRATLGDRQLRLGRDGIWDPYRKVRAVWQPEGEASALPEAAGVAGRSG